MNEVTQVFIQGVSSILVVLIGLAFKELKKFLETKAEHIKAKTDLKQYELMKSIAATVVQAVEQVYKDVANASQEKLAEADKRLTKELEANGIYVDGNTKRLLIESVVNGMNELKTINFSKTKRIGLCLSFFICIGGIMKKTIKRKLHISTYSRDFIDYINHEFYSHDKHNAFFEFTMEQLPTDNVVALFYFQKTKRYAEIHGVVEGNKVTIEFDTSLITTNETVCGYIYFEKVEQSADVCRFCFNVKVSEIDKLKNAPIVEKETRRLIPISEIVTKTELQELFKTIEKNGGTYNDTEIRKSITSIEERVQTLENKKDNNTVYDDSDVINRLNAIESKPTINTSEFAKKTDIPQAYNDSELSRRVSALETKEDKDTVYNDEEIKRRLSNLEGKTDNFISGVSVNKEGNNVTLTYNYVDGQAKNVSFTDSDTINIAYDDSALKSRLNDLENRPQVDVSEFAKKSEVPTVDSVNDLVRIQGEQATKISTLESKSAYEIHGTGTPNGKVEAPIGTTYVDMEVTNGALKWIKQSGTGNTGWKVLIGDTGWRTLNSVSRAGNSFIKIRRVNNLVTYQFGGLSWGWFGVGRRGGPDFVRHNSSGDKGAKVVRPNGIPEGFRSENSLVGPTYDDKGRPYGIWYLGGKSDLNFIQFTFNENIPTDRDIGDIRVSAISYVTDEDWPTRLP